VRLLTYWGNWGTVSSPELEMLCAIDANSAENNWPAWEEAMEEERERTDLHPNAYRQVALTVADDDILAAFLMPVATARVQPPA
jgi:hypothetical protein